MNRNNFTDDKEKTHLKLLLRRGYGGKIADHTKSQADAVVAVRVSADAVPAAALVHIPVS